MPNLTKLTYSRALFLAIGNGVLSCACRAFKLAIQGYSNIQFHNKNKQQVAGFTFTMTNKNQLHVNPNVN